jgi:hypothetical protein
MSTNEAAIVSERVFRVETEIDWGVFEGMHAEHPEIVALRLTKAVVGKIYRLVVFTKTPFKGDRKEFQTKTRYALEADSVHVTFEVV